MIEILITKKCNAIIEFSVRGHSGPVLCERVSATTQMAGLWIEENKKGNIEKWEFGEICVKVKRCDKETKSVLNIMMSILIQVVELSKGEVVIKYK